MILGQIWQSIQAWQKLSKINMRPKLAYKILKYTQQVSAEYDIIERQRVALIHELTNTKEGESAKIEPNTPESLAYGTRFNEILLQESDLPLCALDFEEVVDTVDEKDESLTVNDLAVLEPFFLKLRTAKEEESFRNEDGTPKLFLDDEGKTS